MKLSDILTDESKWIKGNFALDANDKIADPTSPIACKFCLGGAMSRLLSLGEAEVASYGALKDPIKAAIKSLYGFETIVSFNDDPTTEFAHIKKVIEVAGV